MADGANEQPVRPEDDFGLSAVRELLHLLSQSDITEIQIERGDSKLHIKRERAAPVAHITYAAPPPSSQGLPPALAHQHPGGVSPAQHPPAPTESDPLLPGQSTITAPMVGTFYRSPSPKDKPYVEENDIIQPGDRVGIIEAMKMMNEIESEVSGRVVRVLVKNAQPVEYGQVLMVVEPL